MFLSKKIAKLQKLKEAQFQKHKFSPSQSSLHDPQSEFQPSQRSPDAQRKTQRYRFKQIPPHSKYVNDQPIYSLHGVFTLFFFRDFSININNSILTWY